jgi:uncharacterized membrane protein
MGLSWPHVHLMINHFPIILAVLGVAAVVFGLIIRSRGVWLYGVASLTLMGLSAYPAVFTGHQADHALHDPWYIARGAIDHHQDAAEAAMWVMLATGLLAAYAWWRAVQRDDVAARPAPWLRVSVLLAALASLGTVSWAAWLGGEIVQGSPILQGPAPAEFARPEGARPDRAQPGSDPARPGVEAPQPGPGSPAAGSELPASGPEAARSGAEAPRAGAPSAQSGSRSVQPEAAPRPARASP